MALFRRWLAWMSGPGRRTRRANVRALLSLDERMLADIGLRPADVRSVVHGGVSEARLADRGGRWAPASGEIVIEARRRPPLLRGVAGASSPLS